MLALGVGVGDPSASPTAALLLSILQESMGRIATILFAHKFSTSLEPECKMYRLAADVFNDAAMILDCLSPALPRGPRVLLLSFSSVLRALCGVAAGSSKASLSAHFAKWGNIGELNAVSTVLIADSNLCPIFHLFIIPYLRASVMQSRNLSFPDISLEDIVLDAQNELRILQSYRRLTSPIERFEPRDNNLPDGDAGRYLCHLMLSAPCC